MQFDQSPAERRNLGHHLAARLHELIAAGRLPDGGRINEVRLAGELGVSRTPLREALMGLVAEGVVEVKPRRGFFVAPLSAEELADLYAMRALLDPEALSLSGIPSPASLQELRTLNERLERARAASRVIDLDNRWHRLLVSRCPNRVLVLTIEQFITLTRRYEEAYFREAGHVQVAFDQHRRILIALESRDLRGACRALKQNMQSGIGPLQDWVRSRR